jgi:anaerobic selenocysteine-containing dehydrogenase
MTVVRQTCPLDCPDACSLLVTLENERAIKIAGDPNHPVTNGFACSKTYRYHERAYLETRPKYPQKRLGKKGQGRWQRLSWDEALDEIAARVQKILEQHGAESILRYNYAGTMGLHQNNHAHALFRALGAIELEETICATTGSAAWAETYGNARFGTNPEDVPHAKLILLWGINSLATNSHLTPFLTKARRGGAKIVHIDPYENKTSLFADQHIRIRPGTDAALALFMANQIISSQHLDTEFIALHTRGFEEYKQAAQTWTLERTALTTGIDAATLQNLVLEYAQTTPSFIRTSYGMTRHEGGGNAQRAITMLPVLTGQWKHLGAAFDFGGISVKPLKTGCSPFGQTTNAARQHEPTWARTASPQRHPRDVCLQLQSSSGCARLRRSPSGHEARGFADRGAGKRLHRKC